MKKVISLALVLMLANLTVAPSVFALRVVNAVKPQSDAKLTNRDVIDMIKTGLSADIVIAKIKSSPTNFDTSAAALKELKAAKVPDTVILAMVQAPLNSTAANNTAPTTPAATETAPATGETEVKISDGTEIEVELKNTVSGESAKVGDIVDFTVLRPVQINGVTVIDKGAPARGRITTAKGSGRWGKAGKLEWAMQDVQAIDGSRIPARFTKRAVGDSSGGTVAVAAVATTVLLGPVGLLWGLKKGKAAIIPAGNRYSIFAQGDSTIKVKATK